MKTLIDPVVVVPMRPLGRAFRGAVVLDGGRIDAVLAEDAPRPAGARRVDGKGRALLPGFVQTHVHLCQTLFRGAADDLPLLEWLARRIWPLEAAHDAASLAASTRLAVLELLRGGTTSVLTMETVHDTEAVFEALLPLPIRAVVGKCLMDAGEGVPPRLVEPRGHALEEALRLAREAESRSGGRLRGCLAPRFALSCSEPLLRDVAAAAAERGLLVHTHGSEQVQEVDEVLRRTGRRNVRYFQDLHLVNERLRLAHAVHLDEGEEEALAGGGVHVLHCPSSNLKLGSGVAPVTRYLERGIAVSLGADGAPCNNSLDALREARLAALLQKPLFGADALDAWRTLELATLAGARALGLEESIGSIEPGKRADLVEIDLSGPHVAPLGDVASRIVYASERGDVRRVWFDGEVVVEDGRPLFLDPGEVVAEAVAAARRLCSRAGLAP